MMTLCCLQVQISLPAADSLCLFITSILENRSLILQHSVMGDQEVEVIHSWSAPRSLSTALMYSFSQVCTSLISSLVWLTRKKKMREKGKKMDEGLEVWLAFGSPLIKNSQPIIWIVVIVGFLKGFSQNGSVKDGVNFGLFIHRKISFLLQLDFCLSQVKRVIL